jgi:hypothetical protein
MIVALATAGLELDLLLSPPKQHLPSRRQQQYQHQQQPRPHFRQRQLLLQQMQSSGSA